MVLLLKWKQLPPEIPLFFSLPRGEEMLGTKLSLLILPLLSTIFFIINFMIAAYLYTEEKIVSVFLIIISVVSTLLLLITFLKILFLVS